MFPFPGDPWVTLDPGKSHCLLIQNNQNCTLYVPEGLFCLNVSTHSWMHVFDCTYDRYFQFTVYPVSWTPPPPQEGSCWGCCMFIWCDIAPDNLNKLYVNTTTCYCKEWEGQRDTYGWEGNESNIEIVHGLGAVHTQWPFFWVCSDFWAGCTPDGPSWNRQETLRGFTWVSFIQQSCDPATVSLAVFLVYVCETVQACEAWNYKCGSAAEVELPLKMQAKAWKE